MKTFKIQREADKADSFIFPENSGVPIGDILIVYDREKEIQWTFRVADQDQTNEQIKTLHSFSSDHEVIAAGVPLEAVVVGGESPKWNSIGPLRVVYRKRPAPGAQNLIYREPNI